MSLFRGSLRPPAIISDEAIERYLAAIRSEIEPDPLFRRRLRGHVVNRYVAAREGHAEGRSLPPEMSRVGRAVLVATFGLSLSVTSVMAASQQAIPGDALYPLKRHVEALRIHVVPAHLQDELAGYHLGQRIEELGRLVETGRWAAVADQARTIERSYAAAAAAGAHAEGLGARMTIVREWITHMPASAQARALSAMQGIPGLGRDGAPSTSGAGGGIGGANNDGANPMGPTNAGGPNSDGSSGDVPDHASTNRDATEPERGGQPTQPSSADRDRPSATPPLPPEKGPRAMPSPDPTDEPVQEPLDDPADEPIEEPTQEPIEESDAP